MSGLIFLGLVAACRSSVHEDLAHDFPSPSNYRKSELTYSSVFQRVLRPSCVGCHGNSGGIGLETYAGAKTYLAKIYRTAITERSMPKAPTPALTPDQLGILNAWIQTGAPEFAQVDEPKSEPLEANFQSIKFNILDVKCVQCHAPGKPVARIPLVTKDDLLNSPLELVIPGNPEESGIMIAIWGLNPEKLMPPPKDARGNPTGFSKLTDQETEAIALWITNGATD